MSGWKKLAAASAAGGAGLDVDEVFSTYLWIGNELARNIVNGIDLSTEGGLVWTKNRDTSGMSHALVDTERGANKILTANSTSAEINSGGSYGVNGFNVDGFSLPSGEGAYYENRSGKNAVAWTFRKAPKLFDVVTYTGTGSAQNISHDLGCDVGMLIVKCTNDGENWRVWHRNLTSGDYYLALNNDQSERLDSFNRIWNATAPTSTQFTVGTDNSTNGSGKTYVAYLFAHNNGDGEFGPSGDQDIIKCGSYIYSNGLEVDLGFEPQWLLYKQSSTTGHWRIVDNMRGWGAPSTEKFLYPSLSNAEAAGGQIDLTSTGFKVHDAGTGKYIYMAIRRGSLFPPESASEVFDIAVANGTGPPYLQADFPVDFAFERTINAEHDWNVGNRQTGTNYLTLNTFRDEDSLSTVKFDYQNGWMSYVNNGTQSWMWKRAPGYFDTVLYYADGVQGRAINHNLGVVPEMMWVKKRSANQDWYVYHKDLGNTKEVRLNKSTAPSTNTLVWNSTTPDETTFTVGNATNNSAQSYACMLFATAPGVSKVGGWTGNGASSRTIDCGFSNGARFIFVRDVSSSYANWWTVDTQRGLGNTMFLDDGQAEQAITIFSSNSAGFTVSSFFNASGTNYIFYAVA